MKSMYPTSGCCSKYNTTYNIKYTVYQLRYYECTKKKSYNYWPISSTNAFVVPKPNLKDHSWKVWVVQFTYAIFIV